MSRRDKDKDIGSSFTPEKEKEKEKPEIPPIPVTRENVAEIVRILKAGIRNTFQCSDDTKEQLGMWITEREDEIDIEEDRDPNATREASPSSVDIKGALIPPPDPEEEPTPEIPPMPSALGPSEEPQSVEEKPFPEWDQTPAPKAPDHWEKQVEQSGSAEQAAADKQQNYGSNPPLHLRGNS
jgi:hypothetical protein